MATTTEVPRLLITGASGFIGRHLLGALKHSHHIFALARGAPERTGAPRGRYIEWMHADIADVGQMEGVCDRILAEGGVDIVVHLAAYYDFTGKDAPEYQRTNIDGMRNVLEVAKRLQPRSFIFASSAAACDFTRPGEPITEKSPPDGRNPYARSKRVGEQLIREYQSEVRSCIIRFAAIYSDWCEYEPLNYFLKTWLSPGWRRRVLGGRGRSAIPYMHIQDAVAFFERLLQSHQQLDNGQILLASTDSSVTHSELHAVATACHFGQRIRPIRLPRPACLMGIWCLDTFGRLIGHRPFERPWMGQCIDRRLDIDASATRVALEWAPRERLDILRRMPFLIQNRKAHPAKWLSKNHVAPERVRLRSSAMIHRQLSASQVRIMDRFEEHLATAEVRGQLPSYVDCTRAQLRERHRLLLEQLMCAVRAGDKAVFMNCCRHMAERWWSEGRPLREIWEALDHLRRICESVLTEDAGFERSDQALYDQVSMTFQFAIDAVKELDERLGEHAGRVSAQGVLTEAT